MDSLKFVLEVPGANIFTGALIFGGGGGGGGGALLVCDNLHTLLGALLFGRVLLIGTLW